MVCWKAETLLDKSLYSQGYGLPSGHIRLWELDRKEGRMPKNRYLWTVVLRKTPERPLDSKEIKPVNLKGHQPSIFWWWSWSTTIWSSDVNRQLIGRVPDAGKDWGQEKREVEMARQHHRWNEHELGQTPGDGEEQGGLVFCSPRGCKESDTTGWLNNNSNKALNQYKWLVNKR